MKESRNPLNSVLSTEKVFLTIPCQPKGLLKVLTGSQRQPDVWGRRVDEAEYTSGKQIKMLILNRSRNHLESNGQISGDVWCEVEAHIGQASFPGIISSQHKAGQGFLATWKTSLRRYYNLEENRSLTILRSSSV